MPTRMPLPMLASDTFSCFGRASQKARAGSALAALNGTGCMDERRAHKSQILRVNSNCSRVVGNPEVIQMGTEQDQYREVRVFYFLGCSGLPARSEWPRWAHSSCCSGVIVVGVSPPGTELQRIVSSNPGAEKMKVRLTGSAPVFFKLIQVFAGIKTSPPAWSSRS